MMANSKQKNNTSAFLRMQSIARGIFARPITLVSVTLNDFLPRYTAHSHNELEILFVTNGKGRAIVNGYEGYFSRDDLIILPPRCLHSVIPTEGELIFTAIAVNPSVAWQNPSYRNLAQMMQTNNDMPIVMSPNQTGYQDFLRHANALSHSKTSAEMLEAVLHMLTDLYSDTCAAHKHNLSENKRSFAIMRALEYVQDNYCKPISVEDVASFCNYSSFYIMKLFKCYTGLSLVEYLNYYRLLIATQEMISSDNEIQLIAQQVGFNNISYFNRQFKRFFNTTPRHFKLHFVKEHN